MLLSRYSNIEYILGLTFDDGFKLTAKAIEQSNEEMLYERWLQGYEKELSFGDFKDKLYKVKDEDDKREIDRSRTKEHILEENVLILDMFR